MKHPLFYVVTRLKLRSALREKGYSRAEVNDLVDGATDDVIDAADAIANAGQPESAVGAIGDGTLIQKFFEFLQSPAGQALLAALMKLLLGGL